MVVRASTSWGWLSSTAYCSPMDARTSAGFFQEDFEQFRVDLLVAGLGELERRAADGAGASGSHGTWILWKWIESSGFQGGKGPP